MGRWESTRKIRPFRGVYIYGDTHRDKTTTDDGRIKAIQQAKREEQADDDFESVSEAEMQNIEDEYSVPQTQAEEQPKSFAQELSERDESPLLKKTVEELKEDEGVKVEKPKRKYNTASKSTTAKVIDSAIDALPYQDGQNNRWLTTLATSVGVQWEYDPSGKVRFSDKAFEIVAGTVIKNNKEGVYNKHLSTGGMKTMIEKVYHKCVRDPVGFGSYEILRNDMIEHYGLKKTTNDDGNPIGNYKKYLKIYDEVFDAYRREDKYPTAWEVIEAMDELLAKSKLTQEQKKKQFKQMYISKKEKEKTPAEKLYSIIDKRTGLIY